MKKLFILALAAASFASCQQSKPTAASDSSAVKATNIPVSPDAAVISFEHGMYNFGKITQGEQVHYDFKFKNTGKSPLIVTNVSATCGCTVPEKPKGPVKPGEDGVIKVVFSSAGKMGMQDKIVTITSNANPATTEVHLIGEVTEATSK
ncbi:MAG TPA: DUF1573 domain-containing protein [Pedobacter sp.]